MQIIKEAVSLKDALLSIRKKGLSIGFVPTMGALHQGHISLVERAKSQNSIVVASIFVNPTQFNDKNDFKHYPRTPEKDAELLQKGGCDLLFIPNENEMYPEPDHRVFDFGEMGNVMEGKHRPGHFNGVAIIVSKLLDMVMPDKLYLGQKDFQQVAIIKQLVKQLNLPVEIIACPTLREKNGLAMSSRNERLNSEQRAKAKIIYETLCEIKRQYASVNTKELIVQGIKNIEQQAGFTVEYLEIVCGDTLMPAVTESKKCNDVVACIAVKAGNIRLIDNLILT